jgi:hypothetical protein
MVRIARLRVAVPHGLSVRPRKHPPSREKAVTPQAAPWRRDVLACATLALIALASRVAYVVGTLEHWDTVNFALALDRFDPVHHQPHPPGQVLFVGVARLLRTWTGDNVYAVSLTNALLGSLAVIPLYGLALRWTNRPTAWLAGFLFIVNPCLWLNSIRPLSDGAALLPMLTAVVLLLSDRPHRALMGYLVTALALGFRQQLLFPLGPFLAYMGFQHIRRYRWTFGLQAGALFLLGTAVWVVPTVAATGGIASYWQGSRSILQYVWEREALIHHWDGSHLRTIFARTFGTVWGWPWVAGTVWAFIGVGLRVLGTDRTRLTPWLILTVPTVAWRFLMLWHDGRYAVPYLPFLILALALGLYEVGYRLWERWPAVRLEALSLTGLVLIGGQILFAFPTVDHLRRHHTPIHKATRLIVERYEPSEVLLITDDWVIRRHLDYYGPRIGAAFHHETQLSPSTLRAYPRWLLLTSSDRPALGTRLIAQWEWYPGLLFRLESQRNLEHVYLYEFGPGPYMTFTGWYEWEKERHPFRYFRWLGGEGGEIHFFPLDRRPLRLTVAGQVPTLPAGQVPCAVDVGVGRQTLGTLTPGPFEQTWVIGGEAVSNSTLRMWWRPRRSFRPLDLGETPDPRPIGCVRLFTLSVQEATGR